MFGFVVRAASSKPRTLSEVNVLFERVVGYSTLFLGIALFIVLIIGGFQLMFSGGEPQKVKRGKNTITWAVGGIVLASLAYLILILIQKFTGQGNITQFNIIVP